MLLQKYIYILTMFQVVKLKEIIISFSLTGKNRCFKHRLHKILDVTAVMSLSGLWTTILKPEFGFTAENMLVVWSQK